MIEKLLWLAEKLAQDGARSAALKRRAVSTAYYAVFHSLARLCADSVLVEDGEIDSESEDYERVYRALDHGPLRNAFANGALRDNPDLKSIGDIVVPLQSERLRSDYLPAQSLYTSSQCRALVRSAKVAVELIENLHGGTRRKLIVALLFKNRPV